MLDKSKLLKLIDNQSNSLFYDNVSELELARAIWQQICQNSDFQLAISNLDLQFALPSWQGQLDAAVEIDAKKNDYKIISTDGSQIYPDRHQGTSCSLINIGSATLNYGELSSFAARTEPFLFTENSLELSPELIDCVRQEYEFKIALELMQKEANNHQETMYLFDGSLIFWHLETKGSAVQQEFLGKYLGFLYQFYKLDVNIAGYISLPKSKDLVNLIRAQLLLNNDNTKIEYILDSHIASFYLNFNQRSTIFKSYSAITNVYPQRLQPHFFYLDVGQEIVRIEIPYYITQNLERVNKIASIILDQCNKGQGYPVVIAEAHEQAVIKSADRDFFYQMIYKSSSKHKQKILTSRKSLKKRLMGI